MSWESSIEYERIINTEVRDGLGGAHSADLLIQPYDFAAIGALEEADDWEGAGALRPGTARGVVRDESRTAYLAVVDRLVERGAEGAIAGCTEIEQLVAPDDVPVPWFPTTRLLARAAVDRSLAE